MNNQSADVSLVLGLYPTLAGGDRDALDALLDPDLVGETTAGLPLGLGGRWEGATAMRRRFWGGIARAFEVVAHPREAHQLADGRVVVIGTYVGSCRSTGRKLEAEFVHLVTVSAGRITALTQLTDSARWAEALVGRLAPVPEACPPAVGTRPAITTLRLDVSGPIAEIRLNRPHAANAIDPPMAGDLLTAALAVAAAESPRALVLTAEGRTFSPGGDLRALSASSPAELSGLLDEMLTDYHRALLVLAHLDIPIVAAVTGSVGGGSLGLIHMADIVIADDGTKFAVGSGALGLGSDGGNTWFLPRLVGRRVAAQMCYLNRILDAAEALQSGLVSEVVPAGQAGLRAREVADRLAAGSPACNARLRELLRPGRTLAETLDAEREGMVALACPEVIDAMRAFLTRKDSR